MVTGRLSAFLRFGKLVVAARIAAKPIDKTLELK